MWTGMSDGAISEKIRASICQTSETSNNKTTSTFLIVVIWEKYHAGISKNVIIISEMNLYDQWKTTIVSKNSKSEQEAKEVSKNKS